MTQTAGSLELQEPRPDGGAPGGQSAPAATPEEIRDAVVAGMPEWAGSAIAFEVLPGGTSNVNYLARVDGQCFVIKVLTEQMDDLGLRVPISHVLTNTEAAGRTGLGPQTVRSFPEMSALVLECIGGRTLTIPEVGAASNIPRIGRAVRTFHDDTDAFSNRIEFFEFLDTFLRLLDEHSLHAPDGLLDFLPAMSDVRAALAKNPLPLVPSHNDLLSSNIMDDGRIRLIDYDFSAMNDPCFDLGDLAMEADYGVDQVEALCESYFGEPNPTQMARVRLFGIVAQYTWAVWETLMDRLLVAKPDPDFDYHKEAYDRWSWARRKLESPDFGAVLDAARTP
ncbi:MAG TPA: choline kinase family protein [Candidatus Dormibacteraeota bacterium]